jgi:hypothetical protein
MDALRTELREYFWDGEFRDTVGATVRVTGDRGQESGDRGQGSGDRLHHPYAVFVSRRSGKAGVAVANYDEKQAVTVTIQDPTGLRDPSTGFGQARSGLRYRLVDDPMWRSAADGIVLPPMSAAVVVGE